MKKSFYHGNRPLNDKMKPIPWSGEDISPRKDALLHGIVFKRSRNTVPVSEAFSGIAYLRKLAAHRIRVKREEPKMSKPKRKAHPKKYGTKPFFDEKTLLAPGVTYGDLKTVCCFRCGKVLLSPQSHDFVYALPSSKRKKVWKALPSAVPEGIRFVCLRNCENPRGPSSWN